MVTWLHLLVSYDVTSYVFNWLQLVTLVTCNWLHFDLGGYMVTAHWLQVLNGLILSVTYRRTQQPRPHCPPLCSLLSAPPARPPLMLRTAALDFVNVCQLIAAPISFLLPRKNSTRPTYTERLTIWKQLVNSAAVILSFPFTPGGSLLHGPLLVTDPTNLTR